jgi:TolA-binding protein
MRRLTIGIVASFALSGAPALAQWPQPPHRPANELIIQNYSPEFPPLGAAYATIRFQFLADHTARLLKEAPGAPETLDMLVLMDRPSDAAEVLRRMIRDIPEESAWAFELLGTRNVFRSLEATGPLPQLIEDARQQLDRLTRPAAARLEHAIIFVEHTTSGPSPNLARENALRALIAKYPGTDAALEAEVDLITSATANRAAWIQPLEEFASRHPGTTAAAKALYEKAFQFTTNLNLRAQDPTDRFLEVFAIVSDLRSGRYPASRWVAQAPGLAIAMFPRNAQFRPGNLGRLLAGYVAFVQNNFAHPEMGQLAEGVNGVVIEQIADLFARIGEGTAGVERTIADLEQIDATRARFLRGAFYLNRLANEPAATRPALLENALGTMSALASSGTGLYSRRALATVASLQYAESNFAAARTTFAAYLAAYPDTSWSWVAAIRIGQCHQLLGDVDRAIEAYRSAATRYGALSVPRELAHAFAGRAAEAVSRFDEAAAEYERALATWGDLRRSARMEGYGRVSAPPAWTLLEVQGQALQTRLDELRASLVTPEGTQLERGRWLLITGDRAGARDALDAFVRANPNSTLGPDARRLVRRTRLELAIEMAGPMHAPRDDVGAIAALGAIDSEPWDEIVGVAKIVAATLTFRGGSREQADGLMTTALREWREQQAPRPTTMPAAIAADVAAIRRQIFEREGPNEPWRASFQWSRGATPAFKVVNPDVFVQLVNEAPARQTVYPASDDATVLFMTSGAMATLVEAMNSLAENRAGPLPRVPPEMLNFLTAHLPAEPGMIGGLTSFASVPNVQLVTFTNAARTAATVGIRTWFSGGTLRLEKSDGAWHVVGVGGTYVN